MTAPLNTKQVLWSNVSRLMRHHYGRDNLNRLANECEFAVATATRLKEMQTSVGLDIVEKLAAKFGLEPWQLLTLDLDPEAPPLLAKQDELEVVKQYLARLMAEKPPALPWNKTQTPEGPAAKAIHAAKAREVERRAEDRRKRDLGIKRRKGGMS